MNLFFKLFKWNWYWKLLKLSFFSLLISCFTFWLGCFASASYSYYVRQIWDYWYNPFIQSQDIAVIKNWTPLTQLLWYTKRMIWLWTDSAFFWNSWNPAFLWNYDDYYSYQHHYYHYAWVVKSFSVCDELDWSEITSMSNCSSYTYDSSSYNLIYSFLQTVSNSDYYVILNGCSWNWCNYQSRWFWISSSQLWQTLYFSFWNQSDSVDKSIIPLTSWNLDFSSFPDSLLGYPPSAWSSWEWDNWWVSDSWNIDIDVSWSYTYTNCTYQALIDYIESVWASKYLCYWWLDNFDLYNPNTVYNPIPWTWKTLAQILSYSNSWDTPIEWFNFWNWLRWWYVDIWSSYPAVYKTWFDIYYQYWWNSLEFDAVREYCIMIWLDIDFSNTVYKWQYFKQTCNYIQKNNIWIYDWSWNVVVWVNWWWIWNYTWTNLSWTTVYSPVWYIQNFFNELKANFPTRSDFGGGTLPVYIITFLCAIVLFRFLRH